MTRLPTCRDLSITLIVLFGAWLLVFQTSTTDVPTATNITWQPNRVRFTFTEMEHLKNMGYNRTDIIRLDVSNSMLDGHVDQLAKHQLDEKDTTEVPFTKNAIDWKVVNRQTIKTQDNLTLYMMIWMKIETEYRRHLLRKELRRNTSEAGVWTHSTTQWGSEALLMGSHWKTKAYEILNGDTVGGSQARKELALFKK